MGYLIQDQQKCIEAEELAVALMGWSMNPPVVDATKWGILAAWAYSESILDVRALLEGRRIAWIKMQNSGQPVSIRQGSSRWICDGKRL